jgi:bifunctional non-homologous end joining protein LigD
VGRLPPLAYIDQGTCRLVSRRGYRYKAWPQLAQELARTVRCRSAVLDGELCCLAPDGRSQFYSLMFRRDRPFYLAFDLLWLDGCDLRARSLSHRKARLERILPRTSSSRVRNMEHVVGRGIDLLTVACDCDLEGIVAKWAGGTYQSGRRTSWLKVRNPHYSQWDGRRDLFETRRDNAERRVRWVPRELALR